MLFRKFCSFLFILFYQFGKSSKISLLLFLSISPCPNFLLHIYLPFSFKRDSFNQVLYHSRSFFPSPFFLLQIHPIILSLNVRKQFIKNKYLLNKNSLLMSSYNILFKARNSKVVDSRTWSNRLCYLTKNE